MRNTSKKSPSTEVSSKNHDALLSESLAKFKERILQESRDDFDFVDGPRPHRFAKIFAIGIPLLTAVILGAVVVVWTTVWAKNTADHAVRPKGEKTRGLSREFIPPVRAGIAENELSSPPRRVVNRNGGRRESSDRRYLAVDNDLEVSQRSSSDKMSLIDDIFERKDNFAGSSNFDVDASRGESITGKQSFDKNRQKTEERVESLLGNFADRRPSAAFAPALGLKISRDAIDSAAENFVESQTNKQFSFRDDALFQFQKSEPATTRREASEMEVYAWLHEQKVQGVAYKGKDSRLIINDKVLHVGDVVPSDYGLVWKEIRPKERLLYFEGDNDKIYVLPY
jgi:hypothetical protein